MYNAGVLASACEAPSRGLPGAVCAHVVCMWCVAPGRKDDGDDAVGDADRPTKRGPASGQHGGAGAGAGQEAAGLTAADVVAMSSSEV